MNESCTNFYVGKLNLGAPMLQSVAIRKQSLVFLVTIGMVFSTRSALTLNFATFVRCSISPHSIGHDSK